MPQNALNILTINDTAALTDAPSPVPVDYLVEVQSGGRRFQAPVSDVITGSGGVAGVGTSGVLPIWTASATQSNSLISQSGTMVTMGGSATVSGTAHVTGAATIDGAVVVSGGSTVNGAATVSGTMHLDNVAAFTGLTFSGLPTPAAGMLAYITDSNVTSGNVTSGGGADKVIAWYDGTNWVVIGA